MDKHEKNLHIIIEIMQWTLILFTLFACLFICPNVKRHIDNEKNEKIYRQINTDQQIERLNREKMELMDSIINLKHDTVYVYKNCNHKMK